MFENAELLIAHAPVVVLFIHLRCGEAEDEVFGPAVTDHALGTAGIVPFLALDAAGVLTRGRNADFILTVNSVARDQLRIGLLVVPAVRVARLFAFLFGEKPRFDPASALGVARGCLQGEGFYEDS